ncbi:MAG: efflux RND transporter permease subunit [Aquificaceae bacterium]|nr:efflux RND transporter permease subunit [Aquificaceae bacterium]
MHRFFLHRPVTSWMFMIAFILLGIYSLRHIPIDRLPDVDFPTVTIVTTYPGANAYVVDVNVTRKIEDQIATISGIETISSASFSGTSRITITFSLEKDIDVAAQEVRDAVQRVLRRLPEGVDPPVVRKVDTSLSPVFVTLLHSKTADYQTIAYWADKIIKREFERINGVGQVDLGGFRDNVLWVRIDPEKLYSRGLAVQDVLDAVSKNHIEAPAGAIYGKEREYIIRLYGKAQDPKELEGAYIRNGVRLRDVGFVEFTEDEFRGMSRYKGEQAVVIVVYKQSKTNTVQVVDAVKAKMEEINKQLPPGMRMDYTFDSSIFVKDSVRAAIEEIIIGSLLTALVVYFFLGSLKLTFVPIFAIPITLLGTVFLLHQLGNSLNTFTLLGLAVAVGIVIDDAIVVLESIYRRRYEEGLEPLQAGDIGTKVVIFALLASTASLVIVFIPIIFLKGVVGKLFGSFALTLVVAIALSYLVAISFTPMAVSRLVFGKPPSNPFTRTYDKFEALFDRLLRWSLEHKTIVIVASLVSVFIGFGLFRATKKEFFPIVDEGRFLVRFETPTGSSFEYTIRKAEEIEALLLKNPYVDRFGMAVGQGVAGRPDVNGGMGFVYLKEGKRPHQARIMEMVREEFRKIRDVRISVEPPALVGPGGGRQVDLQYAIRGSSLEELQSLSERLTREFRGRQGYRDVDTDLRLNEPQAQIRVDRGRLGDLGINVEDVAVTLNVLFGKFQLGTYELGAESYDLYVKALPEFLQNLENLKKVFVRNHKGELVPLSELVEVKTATGYKTINRYNRQYSFTFFSNLAPEKSLAEAVVELESWLRNNLPPGYIFEPVGQAREFQRAFQGLGFALVFALVGVYMVLASLFESYRHPFTVILMVPLAVAGAFGLLLLTKTSLSVPSYFGIILLVGIIVRDAVLFIERIIQLRKEGMQTREAILQARKERLRPILMTTFTIVSALTPVALGLTAGAELRKPLALAVIGGIFTGLPLSLFLLPVLYELFDKIRLRRA